VEVGSLQMTPAPLKPTVPFSALAALDIRVGTIKAVEDVPGSAKLLRLVVDFGDHSRTILAGGRYRAGPRRP
jgi:tRNA-binding protein